MKSGFSNLKRKFFGRNPGSNEPIRVIQGEMGFYPLQFAGDDSPESVDEKLDRLNWIFGNTPEDVQIAIGCSMFGWDTPLAEDLSPWFAEQS